MISFMGTLCISTHFFCKTTLKNKSIKKKKTKKLQEREADRNYEASEQVPES